ncbi:shikimate dehydrogenase [Candidatus Woesearchaeota archaeon]|nr:shikimate dehydrogenase [Candidatus Woesearchaeota archaeon]
MICIPITASTNDEAVEMIRHAEKQADILELRIDMVKNPDMRKLLKSTKKPKIVTNRKKSEGGLFEGSEEGRLAMLGEAISLGADYIDIELSSGTESIAELVRKKGKSCIIVSYHNLSETPDDLNGIYVKIIETGCDIVKIATFANDITDNIRLIEIAKKSRAEGKKIIAVCMGEKGEISRILYRVFGGFLTYASAEQGKESAPGQLTAGMMRSVYCADRLDEKTGIYGTVGRPAKYSRGIFLFNPTYQRLGLNNVQLRLEVDDLGKFMKEIKKINIRGFSVTTPYKEEVMQYLDELDEAAGLIGAVNTVVVRGGRLKGYNTDGMGAKLALKEKTSLAGKDVVIIGAGGAAKAIAFELSREKCRITILNRTIEKAKELAGRTGCRYGAIGKLAETGYDILINCTSVGMSPNDSETPVGKQFLKNIVMDIVYKPVETRLLREAREMGCETVDGISMLFYQALGQFELWTGMKAPEGMMREFLWKSL